jgi:2-polyprenyl-6-methoxyphenol hydroxylase-like FAD-dependent oxidoreductase
MTDDQVYFYCTICAAAGGKDASGELKTALKRQFEIFGPLAMQIIDSANEAEIIRTDLYDLKPLREWVRGRVALLGDAAHATTPNLGQGGAQAIEDAFVFAQSLASNSTGREVEHALREYQSTRYAKAIEIVNLSWKYGQMSNLTYPLLVAARDWLMPRLPKALGKRQLDRIYRLNF